MTGRKRMRWWAGLAVVIVGGIVLGFLLTGRQPGRPSSDSSLLALTWGPSLCSVDATVRGCKTGNVGRKGQTFLLHGLWPQPSTEQYCGVPKQGDGQRGPELPEDLRRLLATMMSDASVLARHEWLAHGTCSGVTPAEYFSITATLGSQAIEALDQGVRNAPERRVTSRSLRDLFDARFGSGAGARLSLVCRQAEGQGEVVYEVRISLPSVVALRDAGPNPALGEQLAKAPPVPAGCGQARLP